MPILGIIASSISGNLVTNSYESIATVSGDGSSTSIAFNSISGTYKHLQIRYIGRFASGGGTTSTTANLRFNSDSGSNYANHYLRGTGSAADAGAATSSAQNFALIAQSGAPSNVFTAGIIDLLDYQNSNKYKTVRAIYGYEDNSSGELQFRSGLWMNTAAITSITISSTNPFATNSKFALYGIKG